MITSATIQLSRAERRVYHEALTPRSRKEIAWDMHLSPKTVMFHLHNIYRKLGVRDRLALICKYRGVGC